MHSVRSTAYTFTVLPANIHPHYPVHGVDQADKNISFRSLSLSASSGHGEAERGMEHRAG